MSIQKRDKVDRTEINSSSSNNSRNHSLDSHFPSSDSSASFIWYPPEHVCRAGTHHGFVEEGEALELSEGVGGRGELFEHHKRLAPHLHGLQRHDVHDLAKL